MSQVISYKKFNADNVTFVTKKGKNVKIFILYNGKSFYLNTPYLVTNGYGDLYALTSYNLNQGNVTDMDEVSDWTMNLKLKSNQKQDDESIEQFKEQFQKFNNKLFEHVLNDSKLIFGKKKSKEVLEDKFKTLLKFSYDEDAILDLMDRHSCEDAIILDEHQHEEIKKLIGSQSSRYSLLVDSSEN